MKRRYSCAYDPCHKQFLRYYPPAHTPTHAYCSRDCANKAMRTDTPRDKHPWSRRKADTRTAAERGYSTAHAKERKRRLAIMRDGDPCCRCGQPMWLINARFIHLDHHDNDRRIYLGLSHAACNKRAGAKHGQQITAAIRRQAKARRQGRQYPGYTT